MITPSRNGRAAWVIYAPMPDYLKLMSQCSPPIANRIRNGGMRVSCLPSSLRQIPLVAVW